MVKNKGVSHDWKNPPFDYVLFIAIFTISNGIFDYVIISAWLWRYNSITGVNLALMAYYVIICYL